jgi:hypothetical protein
MPELARRNFSSNTSAAPSARQAQIFALAPAVESLRLKPHFVYAYPVGNERATVIAEEDHFDHDRLLAQSNRHEQLSVPRNYRGDARATGRPFDFDSHLGCA